MKQRGFIKNEKGYENEEGISFFNDVYDGS